MKVRPKPGASRRPDKRGFSRSSKRLRARGRKSPTIHLEDEKGGAHSSWRLKPGDEERYRELRARKFRGERLGHRGLRLAHGYGEPFRRSGPPSVCAARLRTARPDRAMMTMNPALTRPHETQARFAGKARVLFRRGHRPRGRRARVKDTGTAGPSFPSRTTPSRHPISRDCKPASPPA